MIVPNHLKIYIKEIAERLSCGRAIVMVGAGFSKNAEKAGTVGKSFLNWNELGDIFYEKIYGHKPDQNTGHYLDALKLASMIENMFGRPVLDKLLLDNLPDEEYMPSELHKKLLELNWADIFTTNYDTLLERARKFVPNKRYQVVVNKEDLVYSQSPRIVKLHGSFPFVRPFIITQEDYRRYPVDFSAFVNTVQQAFIENALCLFGFSGDDPNFLSWIGWIRDNLGANKTSKIYMITVDSKLMFENSFLASKNIIVINIAECFPGEKIEYKHALECFLDELLEYQKSFRRKDWLVQLCGEDLNALSDFWQKNKSNYPGWVVMPGKYRACFTRSIELFMTRGIGEIECAIDEGKPVCMQAVYLFDWIRQICFYPLTDRVSRIYEHILKKADHYGLKIDLEISLLSFFRQNGQFDKYENLLGQMKADKSYTPEQKRRIYCEMAYLALYQFDYVQLEKYLAEWPTDYSDCRFELMHVGLMWEAEQYGQGKEYLEKVLDIIRSAESGIVDFYVLSQEAYILNLLKFIPKIEFLSLGTRKPFTASDNYEKSNRIDYVKSYDCNPENEIELFKHALSCESPDTLIDSCYTLSAQFINFFERIGMCFVIDTEKDENEYIKKAIFYIIRKNFYWGIILSIRTWDETFMREAAMVGVMFADEEEIDCIADYLCCLIRKKMYLVRAGKEQSRIDEGHKYIVWEEYLPDIMSGLLVKSSSSTIDKACTLIAELLKIPNAFLKLENAITNICYCFDGIYLHSHFEEIMQWILSMEDCDTDSLLPIGTCDFMLYDLLSIKTNITELFKEQLVDTIKRIQKSTNRNIMYVLAVLYHIGWTDDSMNAVFCQKVFETINSLEYPLDFYYFVYDIIGKMKIDDKTKCTDKIKGILFREITRLKDTYCYGSEMDLIFTLPVLRKIELLSKRYGIIWTVREMKSFLKYLLRGKKNGLQYSYRDCFLIGYIYPVFLNVIWNQAEDWQQMKTDSYDLIMGITSKDDVFASKYIFTGLYSTDAANVIMAANIFYMYLKEDVDKWISNIREVQAVLIAKIQNCEIEAPFCIELLGSIMNISDVVFMAMRKESLCSVLQTLLSVTAENYFSLLMKAYGAKLASDIDEASYEIEKGNGIVKKWKELCMNEHEHVLVRKQWKICPI